MDGWADGRRTGGTGKGRGGVAKRQRKGNGGGPAVPPPVKATVRISAEADNRLGVHAQMTGLTRSAIVEALVIEHLRRYVVSDRGGARDGPGRVEGAGVGPALAEGADAA